MMVTLTVQIDFNRDGDFTDTYDDISAEVIRASWNLGMRRAYQIVADESRLTIEVRNKDKKYSPENASSVLYPNLKPLRTVQVGADIEYCDDSGTILTDDSNTVLGETLIMWTGWIDAIKPSTGTTSGPYRTVIECTGAKQFLQSTEVTLELMESVKANTVIETALSYVQYPPALRGNWVLGVAGASELGLTTILGSSDVAQTLDEGKTTFPYVGDTWDKFTTAWQIIEGVCQGERGRFFFDREGNAVFWNRHHLLDTVTAEATFSDAQHALEYSYGEDIVNDVRVTFYQRVLSATNDETLWSLDNEVIVKPGRTKTINARFAGATGEKIAGKDIQTPSIAGNTLTFASGSASIIAFSTTATTATIKFRNDSSIHECRIATLAIKGTKLTAFNAQMAQEIDAESIAAYGRKTKMINAQLITDENYAERLAQYEIYLRKDPIGSARSITLLNKNASYEATQISLTIGSRITIAETQTGLSGDYFIIGERHDWRVDAPFTTTYAIEPASQQNYWRLGIDGASELGETTILAF